MNKYEYQPKTGVRCGCKRGVQRDNCPNCEGTGWVIDFAKIRARRDFPINLDPTPEEKQAVVDRLLRKAR